MLNKKGAILMKYRASEYINFMRSRLKSLLMQDVSISYCGNFQSSPLFLISRIDGKEIDEEITVSLHNKDKNRIYTEQDKKAVFLISEISDSIKTSIICDMSHVELSSHVKFDINRLKCCKKGQLHKQPFIRPTNVILTRNSTIVSANSIDDVLNENGLKMCGCGNEWLAFIFSYQSDGRYLPVVEWEMSPFRASGDKIAACFDETEAIRTAYAALAEWTGEYVPMTVV